jgi:hypothetical protein
MDSSKAGTGAGSAPLPFMEHRWGQRIVCRASVRICAGETLHGRGRIRDVSTSGAFIETALVLNEGAPVTLLVLGNESATRAVEVAALVVRAAPGGVGVEWVDAPSGSICPSLGCSVRCPAHESDAG